MDNPKVAHLIMSAIVQTVVESGERGAPSGHLYAGLMSLGCSLYQYESMIMALKKVGVLTESGHLLKANAERAKELNLL
jgi:hypothetical protein